MICNFLSHGHEHLIFGCFPVKNSKVHKTNFESGCVIHELVRDVTFSTH